MPDYSLTDKQTEAYRHLTDKYNKKLLYGGAKGGGKSFFLCLWSISWCLWLIEFFDIRGKGKRPKHPISVGFLGRKRAVDFNDTTLETFKTVIPPDIYEIKKQEKEIIVDGLVKMDFGGLDDTDAINKFNSAEYCFIGIDQAEETDRKDVAVLKASLRFKYNQKQPPYKQLYTANPAECWLKEDFILQSDPDTIFIPALPDDNPYLPDNYKQTLRESFSHDEVLLKAYLDGDWDAFSNVEDAVFQPKWFDLCRRIEDQSDIDYDVKTLACDVATKRGDNFTVLVFRVGNTIVDIGQFKHLGTMQTAGKIKEWYEKYEADNIIIDSDGFGEGVADVLTHQRIPVLEFHGGYASKAIDANRYKNLRSQFYIMTARKLEKQMICLRRIDQGLYEKLKSQACSIKYKKLDGYNRYQIESKEDMRARGIMSPDLIDAMVYSEYGLWMGKDGDIKAFAYR